jgi:hypothetical protein
MARWRLTPDGAFSENLVELAARPDFSGFLPPSDIEAGSSFNPSWWEGKAGFALTARRNLTDSQMHGRPRTIVQQAVVRGTSGALFTRDRQGNDCVEFFDLPSARIHGGTVSVKDMRIFDFDGDPWATFNTGHERAVSRNRLYLAPLDEIEALPWQAEFPNRKKIEKNWGFFSFGGQLHAIYSVAPLEILALEGWNRTSREAHFRSVTRSNIKSPDPTSPHSEWSIGSQPLWLGSTLVFTVHEKSYWLGKFRRYSVRLVEMEFDGRSAETIRVGPRLVHSTRDLSEPSAKNPLAFGVTYGSGLGFWENKLLLGYGVQDEYFRIVEVVL